MTPEKNKVRCAECDWFGKAEQIDRVKDPYPGSDMVWDICPRCRNAECVHVVCDEPGCTREVCCGAPSEDGYRSTCSEHSMWRKEQNDTRGQSQTKSQ